MKILDEIINRVHNLSQEQQKRVLKNLRSLQEGEKRRYQRLNINSDIDAVVGYRVIQSDTQDISASGVYIRTTGKFEINKGARVVFAVPGYDTPFKLSGKSVRSDRKGVAIEFEDMTPYVKANLDEAIWKANTA